jgi:hypothetical protein
MRVNTSAENIFRFLQLRPPRAIEPGEIFLLLDDTDFARKLAGVAPSQRHAQAVEFLRSAPRPEDVVNSRENRELLDKTRDLAAHGGTVADLRNQLRLPAERLRAQRRTVSDLLLAAKFARVGQPAIMRSLETLYRALTLLDDDSTSGERKLADVLRWPLVLPSALATRATPPAAPPPQPEQPPVPAAMNPDRVYRALRELAALDRPEFVHTGPDNSSPRSVPLSLTSEGLARLSTESRQVLDELQIEATRLPVHEIAALLEARLALLAATVTLPLRPRRPTPLPGPSGSSLPGLAAEVRPAGIADLLVVKQHLQKYQRMDIAHVENVLAGERKSRTHRALERFEQTFTTERETTREQETELETAERFELNQETSQTIQRDQQIGFGLNVSGKYGPTVEFSSQLESETGTSVEESTRSALTYAKDIMQRSLERVVERVREEQIRKLIREQEETNVHELVNTDPAATHISGVYQFIEKVYQSQVFNYGVRLMFDFMLPEPASYIWHLENSPDPDLALPTAPPKLEAHVANASAIAPWNYIAFAALFGAEGVTAPPPFYKTSVVSLKHGEEGDEGGRPRSVLEKDIAIPEGYHPIGAYVQLLGMTDDRLTIAVTIGSGSFTWRPTGTPVVIDIGGGHRLASQILSLGMQGAPHPQDAQSKLALHLLAYETNAYTVVANVVFQRSEETFVAWQIKTYDALAKASAAQQLNYEQKVQELRAKAETEAARAATRFGAPPSQNLKTIRGELKKHSISIITEQRYDAFDATVDADPPYFEFDDAAEQGAFIRFFEQAFEWDQLQYVCYPYFWARKQTWADRFRRQDVDPIFLEFLQAGAARVVVPVRPGFEEAIVHFLETGEIWNGSGSPPPINSPLYVSITEEIKERTGAPQGEIPVGDPWPTIVPTPLVILRREETLPEWERQDPQGWEWEESAAT